MTLAATEKAQLGNKASFRERCRTMMIQSKASRLKEYSGGRRNKETKSTDQIEGQKWQVNQHQEWEIFLANEFD